MTDTSPLHDIESDAQANSEHVADVEMSNSTVVENGQQQDDSPQIANAASVPSTLDPTSPPAQLDGTNDGPRTVNGNASASYHPNGAPSSFTSQHQQQQNVASQLPTQPSQYANQQHNFTQPAPLSASAQQFPRQPQSTPQPIASASSTIGTQQGVPPGAVIPPANAHGSPTRVYINSKVTPMLLEGMKRLALEEPEKPLKWLGEWLCKKSEEVEGD